VNLSTSLLIQPVASPTAVGKPARCLSPSAPGLYIDSAAVRQRCRRSAVARSTSGRRRTSAAICVTSSVRRVNSTTRSLPSPSAPGLYIDSAAARLRRRRSAVARPTSGRRRTSATICVTSSVRRVNSAARPLRRRCAGLQQQPGRCASTPLSVLQLPTAICCDRFDPTGPGQLSLPTFLGQRLSVLSCVSTACQLCRLEVRPGADRHRRLASARRPGPVPNQAVVQYHRKSRRSTMA